MLIKLRNHGLLALIFLMLTLGQQYSFYMVKGIPVVPLPLGKYVGMYLFFLLLTLIKGDRLRLTFLSMLLVLNFPQMAHLSYFGTQILPSEIYLLFTQFHEISGTLKEDLQHILIPLIFTVIPVTIGRFTNKRIKTSWRWRPMSYLICLYLLYNPLRTYFTGNTWGRQPSTRELTSMNVYLSTSYFLGRILPHKFSQSAMAASDNSSLKLKLGAGRSPTWDKVIVILGESLTPRHMQLFGYSRATTPFLDSLKERADFFHTIALSGGVSTDIAIAYFMNLGFGAAGGIKAAKGNHCLFSLARKKSFKNHFISIQSSEQLRYISPYLCSSSLDEFRSLEDISPKTVDHQAARDRDLLRPLEDLLKENEKKFIMLHQRGSHSPWNLRYTDEARKFSGSPDPRTDDYDNSVLEFDLFWKELHNLLSRSTQRILVVYLSDHGESLGDDGKWGHGFIGPAAFEVPIIITSFNSPFPESIRKSPTYLTHYNIGLFLAQEMGYQLNQAPEEFPADYEVFGNDIDGFAGKASIKFKEKDYVVEHLP